jgi:hypothetical protein
MRTLEGLLVGTVTGGALWYFAALLVGVTR